MRQQLERVYLDELATYTAARAASDTQVLGAAASEPYMKSCRIRIQLEHQGPNTAAQRAITSSTWGKRLWGDSFSPGGAVFFVMDRTDWEGRLRQKCHMEPLRKAAGWDGKTLVNRHEARLIREPLLEHSSHSTSVTLGREVACLAAALVHYPIDRLCGSLVPEREGEPEGGTASDRALDSDLPPVGFDDDLADVQPQPQAAAGHPARCRALHLDTWRPVERLPHQRLLSLQQARPLVAHGHPRPTPMHLHRDIDRLVLWGVLERVGHVVREHLPDAIGVGLDWDNRDDRDRLTAGG